MSLSFNMDELSSGLSQMVRKLYGVKGRVDKQCAVALEEAGMHLAIAAEERAPRKTGALESAIDFKLIRRISDRSYSVVIYVDDSKTRNSKGRDYSGFAHEQIQPAGDKGLGPGSQAKQAGSDVEVGGDFMVRAMSDEADAAREILFTTLQRIFR